MDAGGVRVAVVQEPPVLLDREATLAAAVGHLRRAADGGARLVVFPEAYVPGYPVWIWRLRPEADFELTSAIHRELLADTQDQRPPTSEPSSLKLHFVPRPPALHPGAPFRRGPPAASSHPAMT